MSFLQQCKKTQTNHAARRLAARDSLGKARDRLFDTQPLDLSGGRVAG
jgi:hypothetical protein